MKGKNVQESFRIMAVVNRTLDKESLTRDAFKTLSTENPEAGREVFDLAKPALLREQAYALYAKYVDPEMEFARMKEIYNHGKNAPSEPRSNDLELAKKKFEHDAATLVGILASNSRLKDAQEIASSYRVEMDLSEFEAGLELYLDGFIPLKWIQ